MGIGMNVWVRATPETAFGVYDVTQASSAIWWRLGGDTQFMMQSDPFVKILMSADSGNKPLQNISNRNGVGGKLRTPVYQSQADALLAFCTTLASGDLSSYTFDWYDSVNVERYVGVKVGQLDLSCSATGDEGILWADLSLAGQQLGTAPTLAQPANTVFPTENPYCHQDSKTGFSIGGSARAMYNQLKVVIKNNLIITYDELQYATNITYAGRTVTASTDFQYTAATDRTAYEAQTARAMSILFSRSSHTLKLDLQTQTRIGKRTRALPIGGISRQAFDVTAFLDATSGTDFGYVVT